MLAVVFCYCGNLLASDPVAILKEVKASKVLDDRSDLERHVELLKRNERIQKVREKIPFDGSHPSGTEKSTSLELVGNELFYRYAYDNKFVYMGRVKNVGSRTYSFVKFEVELRDSSGNAIENDYTYIYGTNLTMTSSDIETGTCLRPGETGFFSFYVETPTNTDGVYYSFDSRTYTSATPDANLVLWQGPWASEDYKGEVDLSGVVKNTGVADLKFGRVACAVSDANNEILDAFFTFIDGVHIDGSNSALRIGKTANFDLSLLFADYSEFRHAECRTIWDDYGASQPPSGGSCVNTDREICLGEGDRFEVKIEWHGSGETAFKPAFVSSLRTADAGMFYYSNPNNLEFLLKVLNGCPMNNNYWVFFAATTNVAFNVTVTDTETGARRLYSNQEGHPADTITDTTAFATCP